MRREYRREFTLGQRVRWMNSAGANETLATSGPAAINRVSRGRTYSGERCKANKHNDNDALVRRLPWSFALNPKLPQMMVHVEVGVTHALCPRHLTKHRVRSELATRSTEALKKYS